MEWNNVNGELPKEKGCYLGVCFQENGIKAFWTGIIEVYFEPQKGWIRAENGVRDVYVLYWAHMPKFPESESKERKNEVD